MKHLGENCEVRYFAQELKKNTFNLTRMNLVMRGITPHNIVVRNGDTLEMDWPYFEDGDPEGTYRHLLVDAVILLIHRAGRLLAKERRVYRSRLTRDLSMV